MDETFYVFTKKGSKRCNRFFDPAPFQSTKPRRRYKPTNRLGSAYRKKINESQLTSSEKAEAHRRLDIAIKEKRDGTILDFRMKIRGIHILPWGSAPSGISRAIDKMGFSIVRTLTDTRRAENIVYCSAKSREGSDHPAVFPVELVEIFIRAYCPPNGVVLDPFMGSGSTAIACMNCNLTYVGIEIDPIYHKESIEAVRKHAGLRPTAHDRSIDDLADVA
jgi:site-specific DNA-methyltransferase (adenine-specific)